MYVQKKYSQFLSTQQGKRITSIVIICFLMGYTYLCAMENNGRGVKAIGMANSFVAVSDNLWAINYNPAGLVQITNIQCSAFLVPEQFGLPELRTTAISIAIPLSFATLGFKVEKFGFDLYRETELGMACSASLDQNISIGLSLNYYRLDIERYGDVQKVLFDGGILAHVTHNIRMGFNFSNITRVTIGIKDENIPQVCTLGACWFPLDDLQLSLEMEKDVRYPASIKAGIEKIIFCVLALRAGVANNPDKYSAGIAIRHSRFEFGYAGYSHYDLGWTHQIELSLIIDN
jgi:hypothetical protein